MYENMVKKKVWSLSTSWIEKRENFTHQVINTFHFQSLLHTLVHDNKASQCLIPRWCNQKHYNYSGHFMFAISKHAQISHPSRQINYPLQSSHQQTKTWTNESKAQTACGPNAHWCCLHDCTNYTISWQAELELRFNTYPRIICRTCLDI